LYRFRHCRFRGTALAVTPISGASIQRAIARLHAALPGLALAGAALLVWAAILLIDRRERPRGEATASR
jgi:hypothetical protein